MHTFVVSKAFLPVFCYFFVVKSRVRRVEREGGEFEAYWNRELIEEGGVGGLIRGKLLN